MSYEDQWETCRVWIPESFDGEAKEKALIDAGWQPIHSNDQRDGSWVSMQRLRAQ